MTKWPRYSNIAPASWLITRDVTEGGKNFNVSMQGVRKVNKGAYASYQAQVGKMPPPQYSPGPPRYKVVQGRERGFIRGLKATFE